ncbi:BTB domain-containing protein [Aphelenchoides besseyi]|nr:BTB domain-containing protein [Aphelenchoides besseyi]
MKRSRPLSVPFLPETKFHVLRVKSNDQMHWSISCNDKFAAGDFDCYLWVDYCDLSSGLENHKISIDGHRNFFDALYGDIMHCMIVYKKPGPICARKTPFSLMVDGKSIQVHKNVLAVKSKFFAQQFEEYPEKLEYSIEGTTHEAVEQMVEFVYLGGTEELHEHLNELYKLSVRFHIDALKEKCVKSLESKRTIGKSPEMFILATKYKDEKLSQLVVKYAEQNGGKESLFLSNAFFHLLETDVKLFMEVSVALYR